MTATLTASKAAQFADAAEALGWEVDREKLPEGGRRVMAYRGNEQYELAWHRNTAGTLVYTYGSYWADAENQISPSEVTNVKAALRDMTKVRAPNGSLLSFDIERSTDVEILAACAGKRLRWQTSFGTTEEGDLPRGGMHYKITGEGTARILHFTDQVHTGFRSVRLSAITEVY